MPPVWVTNAQPGAVTVAVDPVVVGEQAVQAARLGIAVRSRWPRRRAARSWSGVATWLWIDPGAWQDKTASGDRPGR